MFIKNAGWFLFSHDISNERRCLFSMKLSKFAISACTLIQVALSPILWIWGNLFISASPLIWENSQHAFCNATTGFPAKWCPRITGMSAKSPTQICVELPILVRNLLQPIRSTTQIWVRYMISMEFLGLFLSHPFAGKPVVVLQNVNCFCRLRLFW